MPFSEQNHHDIANHLIESFKQIFSVCGVHNMSVKLTDEHLRKIVYSCLKETTSATDIKRSSMNGDNSALPVTKLLSVSHVFYDDALAKMRD